MCESESVRIWKVGDVYFQRHKDWLMFAVVGRTETGRVHVEGKVNLRDFDLWRLLRDLTGELVREGNKSFEDVHKALHEMIKETENHLKEMGLL